MSSNGNVSKWLAGACVALATTAGFAQAETRCNVSTVRQSLASETLCECDVVTTSMLRFIRRSDRFLEVLAETSKMCPGFASVLTNVPTATVRAGHTPDNGSYSGPGDVADGGNDTSGNDTGGDDTGGNDTGGTGGGGKGGGGKGGGGNGNNGGGNGSEGSSPGKGSGANNDES